MITVVHCSSTYKIPLTLLHGSRGEINQWLSRRKLDPLHDTAAGNYRVYPNEASGGGEYCIISLVKYNSGAIAEICALLHEVVHVAIYTFGKIGIPIEDLKEEPFTYYVEYLMSQCLEGIKRNRKQR